MLCNCNNVKKEHRVNPFVLTQTIVKMAKHTITSLAFKIIIGVASVMLMLHYAPISEIPSMYAVECYQSYHVSHHSKLYDFVMMTETAKKVISI